MDFGVLPGPSLPELARTVLACSAAATVSETGPALGPGAACQVPVQSGQDGSPLLLAATGSLLERRLAGSLDIVTVTVPASAPFRALRFTGRARLFARDRAAGISACTVDLRSVEFNGANCATVPVDDYRAAAPDPLWRAAPGILRHLEQRHMAELIGCVRAHGMTAADWIIPCGLDRYGLELLVLTTDGAAAARLSFPGGPVTSLQDVPASIRTTLTCRCQARRGHPCTPPTAGE